MWMGSTIMDVIPKTGISFCRFLHRTLTGHSDIPFVSKRLPAKVKSINILQRNYGTLQQAYVHILFDKWFMLCGLE